MPSISALSTKKTRRTTKIFKIILDAGHYGRYNKSPVVPEYYESHMAWKLHLLLKDALEKFKDVQVITTREDKDHDLDVYYRGKKAKDCDLLISLHSDACTSASVDRATVFCPLDGRNRSHELGKKLAEAIAELMDVSEGKIKTRKGKYGEYYGIMRGAARVDCPLYFIIEHSFHTNEKSARWLLEEENLKKLALLEADIIAQWFGLEEDFLPGDVNGNGEIDSRDYILAKRIYFGTYKPTEEELKRCDMDGDGKVTSRDYIFIKRAYFGTYKN